MSTVWRMTYDPGTGAVNVDFDYEEAAQLIIRTNCAQDVQQFKDGLSRIYTGPVTYYSGSMTFELIYGTLAKVRTLAALVVPIKFYYKYHLDNTAYYYIHIIPEKTERYVAGALSTDEITLNWIQTPES